uniref:Uncharacterized protein n=1 Tax=Rhizophora mucronata TaxID=61149 RepID=A0A2P2PEM4_RHIMU
MSIYAFNVFCMCSHIANISLPFIYLLNFSFNL